MHFKTAASVAVLACAAHVSAHEASGKPYMLMSIPHMSLVRRDTSGYQPEQSVCHDGTTCEDSCGAGYAQCPSHDDNTHCFNPTAKESCCNDGSGNSCDAGYYCTHDNSANTWCCPENMSLDDCAKVYNVSGGLETVDSLTNVPEATSSSTTAAQSTTAAATSTSAAHSSAPTSSAASSTAAGPSKASTTGAKSSTSSKAAATATDSATTSAPAMSETTAADAASKTTAADSAAPVPTNWAGFNGTASSGAAQPTGAGKPAPPAGTGSPVPTKQPSNVSGAASTGMSLLLLVGAGAVALL